MERHHRIPPTEHSLRPQVMVICSKSWDVLSGASVRPCGCLPCKHNSDEQCCLGSAANASTINARSPLVCRKITLRRTLGVQFLRLKKEIEGKSFRPLADYCETVLSCWLTAGHILRGVHDPFTPRNACFVCVFCYHQQWRFPLTSQKKSPYFQGYKQKH